MPADVISPVFTDPRVLWINKEAANNWRSSLTVPDATVEDFGVVKQAENVTVDTSDFVVVLADESEVPLSFTGLVGALVNAGIMAPSVGEE